MILELPQLEELAQAIKRLEAKLDKLEPVEKKEWFTIPEAAQYLRLSKNSTYKLVKRGLLKASRSYNKLVIPIESLNEYKKQTVC